MCVFLVSAGILVASEENNVGEILEKVVGKNVSVQAKAYIGEFIEKRGISEDKVKDVKKVDFNELPKEVNIENINEANLDIHEVSYDNQGKDEKVFVISYSVDKLKAQGDLIVAHDKRQFLNFGHIGIMNDSGFLTTATNVETSNYKGYIMMRKGSITGISTNLEVIGNSIENPGKIEIIILKNGEQISFGNTISTDSEGVKKDYDVQSKGVVEFEQGDVISAYAHLGSGVVVRDVINLIEITTVN